MVRPAPSTVPNKEDWKALGTMLWVRKMMRFYGAGHAVKLRRYALVLIGLDEVMNLAWRFGQRLFRNNDPSIHGDFFANIPPKSPDLEIGEFFYYRPKFKFIFFVNCQLIDANPSPKWHSVPLASLVTGESAYRPSGLQNVMAHREHLDCARAIAWAWDCSLKEISVLWRGFDEDAKKKTRNEKIIPDQRLQKNFKENVENNLISETEDKRVAREQHNREYERLKPLQDEKIAKRIN